MIINWEDLFKVKIKREKSKLKKLDICAFYGTTGHPDFKPTCSKGLRASLRCHSENKACLEYEPSVEPSGEVVMLAKDQSLPDLNDWVKDIENWQEFDVDSAFGEGQQSMWDAGFRKVVPYEPTEQPPVLSEQDARQAITAWVQNDEDNRQFREVIADAKHAVDCAFYEQKRQADRQEVAQEIRQELEQMKHLAMLQGGIAINVKRSAIWQAFWEQFGVKKP